MKQNIENSIKEQLEHFEVPYDSSAWEQMSKNLDARSKQGQRPSSSSNLLKFISAAAVVTGILLVSYYYFTTQDKTTTDSSDVELVDLQKEEQTVALENDENSSKADNNVNQSAENESNVTVQNDELNKATEQSNNNGSHSELTKDIEQTNQTTKEKETDEEVVLTPTQDPSSSFKEPTDADRNPPVRRKFISGKVSATKICEGESITILNEGSKNEFVRVKYNLTDLTIPAGQESQLTLQECTNLEFLNGEGDVIDQTDITVYRNPQVDFSVESNIFEKGLPIVNLKAYGSFKSYNWEIGDKNLTGKSIQANLFNKGAHDAILKVVDHNGCEASKKRVIAIESDYNLMAVSGFRPEGSDHRNRSFMPYALTQRDTEFTLVIIDSRDHGIVYKTQNANEPWNGIDQRTGEMTPADRAYIWKVQLDNTLEGEKSVYAGTIVHD